MSKIFFKLLNGIYWAIRLNIYTLYLKLFTPNKIIICIFNTESQFMHLESVILDIQKKESNVKLIYLVNPLNISALKTT